MFPLVSFASGSIQSFDELSRSVALYRFYIGVCFLFNTMCVLFITSDPVSLHGLSAIMMVISICCYIFICDVVVWRRVQNDLSIPVDHKADDAGKRILDVLLILPVIGLLVKYSEWRSFINKYTTLSVLCWLCLTFIQTLFFVISTSNPK